MSALWSRFGVLNSESGDSSIWGRFGVLSAGVSPITAAGVVVDASFGISLGTVVLGGVTIDSSTTGPNGSAYQIAIGTTSGSLTISGVEDSFTSAIAIGTTSGALTISGGSLSSTSSISGGTIVLGGVTIAGSALDSSFGITVGSSGGVTGPELSSPYTIVLGTVVVGGVTISAGSLSALFEIANGRGVWLEDEFSTPAVYRRPRPVVQLEAHQIAYPFELPDLAQRTIENDRLLAAWGRGVNKWWDDVRKHLVTTVGSASAIQALEQQVGHLQEIVGRHETAPPLIVTRYYGGSTNLWEYVHNRGVRPIVTTWVQHPTYGYVTIEGHQFEDVALNRTSIAWDANYIGHATYAFPSVTV